ncbi:transposase InsO family protein [Tsukamurella ocularis]|nr:transposase InsO family protein [Tsukamurella ocularis]
MALWEHRREGHPVIAGELIHHSDAGSQYTAIKLGERLQLENIAASVGSVGDAYDNALAESDNGLYKTECIRTTIFHEGPYEDITDVEYATAGWVHWYNHDRLHHGTGLTSPTQHENTYYNVIRNTTEPHNGAARNLG